MKTIEERANRIGGVHPDWSQVECMRRGYIKGAKEEHKLLTKWHDPKEPPTNENEVLVKYICGTGGCEFYIVAYYSDGIWKAPNIMFDEYDTILGWREIHE